MLYNKMVGIICYKGKISKGQISKEQKKPPKKKIKNLSQAEGYIRSKRYNFYSQSPINFQIWYSYRYCISFSFDQEIPSYIQALPEYQQALKAYNDHAKSLRLVESSEKFRQARKEQFQSSKNTSHKPIHRANNLTIQSTSTYDAIFDYLSSI